MRVFLLRQKKKNLSFLGRSGGREIKRLFFPTALFTSLKEGCSQYLPTQWLQQPKCYKTKMQIGCRKAPCWQPRKLGNAFTLPIIIYRWAPREEVGFFLLDIHIKDKLYLLKQKQVIAVI